MTKRKEQPAESTEKTPSPGKSKGNAKEKTGKSKGNRKPPGKKRVSSGGNPSKLRVNPVETLPAGTVATKGQQPPAPVKKYTVGVNPDKPIGPGNPPADARWPKGKSANPKGYPKGKLQTKTIIKYWLGMKEEIPDPFKPGQFLKVKVIDTMTLGLINKARKGDVASYRELLDRVEGKPVQSTKLLNAHDKVMEITVGFAAPPPAPSATTKKETEK